MALPLVPLIIGGTAFGTGIYAGRASKDGEQSIVDSLTSFSNVTKIAVLMLAVGGVYYLTTRRK